MRRFTRTDIEKKYPSRVYLRDTNTLHPFYIFIMALRQLRFPFSKKKREKKPPREKFDIRGK